MRLHLQRRALHADRIAGRHRHHRRPDRPAPARRAGGPRGRPAVAVRQQPEAARPRPAQLPRRQRGVPDRPEPQRGDRRRRTTSRSRRACSRSWSRPPSPTRSTSASRPPTAANSTALVTSVNTFLCPSDAQNQLPAGWAGINYRVNYGTSIVNAYGPQDTADANVSLPPPNGVVLPRLPDPDRRRDRRHEQHRRLQRARQGRLQQRDLHRDRPTPISRGPTRPAPTRPTRCARRSTSST